MLDKGGITGLRKDVKGKERFRCEWNARFKQIPAKTKMDLKKRHGKEIENEDEKEEGNDGRA